MLWCSSARAFEWWQTRVKRPALRHAVDGLRRNLMLAHDELMALQRQRLRMLLLHAAAHVPYYRRLFAEIGFDPSAATLPDDFMELPVLSKGIMQSSVDLMHSEVPRGSVITNHTGGSTGQVLTFFQDRHYLAWAEAARRLCFEWCGYQPGARQVFLWGSDVDSTQHTSFKGALLDRIRNLRFINTFDLSERAILQYLDELVRWQPEFIWGYVSSVELLAKYAVAQGVQIRPRAIQTTAEVLTEDHRQFIEMAFDCDGFDRYGCREVGVIAHECREHNGLHVLGPIQFVEILDNNEQPVGSGEIGRVVVTNLMNYAMPFIRYDTGDLAVWKPNNCPCGRAGMLLERIEGRQVDTIVSPSGKLIHGEFFTHLFYGMPGVRQFQVIQETPEQLKVRIVATDDL